MHKYLFYFLLNNQKMNINESFNFYFVLQPLRSSSKCVAEGKQVASWPIYTLSDFFLIYLMRLNLLIITNEELTVGKFLSLSPLPFLHLEQWFRTEARKPTAVGSANVDMMMCIACRHEKYSWHHFCNLCHLREISSPGAACLVLWHPVKMQHSCCRVPPCTIS